MHTFAKINESVSYIREITHATPKVGIILGTGLGGLAEHITDAIIIPYANIPHFPISTVEAHAGELLIGKLGDTLVIAMRGRFHRYEGYTLQEVTFPVRVMKALGIEYLLISNAAGGMNPIYEPGDLVIIEDHINLMGDNPLIGFNDESLGSRWPDMIEPYSKKLIALAEDIAAEKNITLKKGVYAGVTGPCLETRAEYRWLSSFSDLVGMSTVPEVIVAVHSSLKVLGISIVTDKCVWDKLEPVNIENIIRCAQQAEPKLTLLMKEVATRL